MHPQDQKPSSQDQARFSFDEKPIGGGFKMNEISQYPSDYNPDDINMQLKPQPLPLQKRIHSKVWKIRKQALQQLLNEVTEDWNIYQEYLNDTVSFITDANSMCQERALKVLLKYLEGSRRSLGEPKKILKALIEKCLIVQKGETPNLVTEILFWMMDNHQQLLLNEVNENMLNKNPKICASVLVFLQKLLNNYGAKKLKLMEDFGKNFTLLSSSVRPIAKPQTINLFKEMYKWMGDTILGFNMHQEVREQITKFAKTYVREPMVIKRGLNQDQKKGMKPITQNIDDDNNDQPQDVLIPYDSKWVDKILEEPKWKDKKNHLDDFIKKTKVKNIINRDNSHFITLIKRLLSDNNINLLQCGFKVIKNLSKGLKRNFTHPCKVIQSLVFSKLRDSKAMIVDQVQQTLQIMMNSLTIDDFLDDIKQGLKDKAPNMRFQTLRFIQKMIMKKDKKMINAFKILTIQIVDLNQDGSNEVRDKALDVLCKLKSVYGLNFFGDKLKKLQGKKLQTIQNYVDENEDMKIQEQSVPDHNSYQIPVEKKPSRAPSPQNKGIYSQQSQANSIKNSIISQPTPKFTHHSQFESPSESARLTAYQNLLQKNQQTIYTGLIQGFKNKIPMTRETNPLVLKVILNCVKKSVVNTVNTEHLDVLMYHDWKKCKQLLMDFIQNSKLNLPALEYVKNMGILNPPQNHQSKKSLQINQKSMEHQPSQNSQMGAPAGNTNLSNNAIKTFYSSLQNLIPKMSNPDPVIRLQAAETVLDILRPVPIGAPLQSSTQPSPPISQAISQFFNVLKVRIQDSNEEIANNYIKLITQMLAKGFLTKYRTPGRLIISILLQKISNSRLTNLQNFVHEMITNHSVIMWQFLAAQLAKQSMCSAALNIIKMNNEVFFKNADQKSYILPLLTCISKDIEVQKCSQLLDQIVEINGQQVLEKIVKESKIGGFNIENYLKKWNIHINNQIQNQMIQKNKNIMNCSTMFSFGNTNLPHSKVERIASQIEYPWPITQSPSYIFKMISQMHNMGDPFQALVFPVPLTENQLSIIANLRPDLIQDYSDLLIKWIFWRVHSEFQPKNLEYIFNLIMKILRLGFQLHQLQIITLLSALIECLKTHKSLYLEQISKINAYLNQLPLYKQRAFRFWINSFNDPTAPVDQILSLIIMSCSDMIPSQLVTLARYPAVVRNKQFNQYLRANYTEKLLIVYGFKLQDTSKIQQKQIISQSITMDNFSQVQSKYFIQQFERCSSNQLLEKIIKDTQGIPNQFVMQTHLKIMHSIIVPYLHRELSFINVYNYFKHVQKVIVQANCSPFLLNLVKTLSSFLIDLDEMKLENYSQMLKTINKLLLILLEVSQPKHILEVLFILMKQELKTNGNLKLTLLTPKCIGKVIKSPIFKNQYERTSQNTESLTYIAKEFLDIVCTFDFTPDHAVLRAIKTLLTEMMALFPNTVIILENLIRHNMESIPEKGVSFIKQLIHDKVKQNNLSQVNTKSEYSYVNSENSYIQTKDIKNAASIIKSLRPAAGELSTRKGMQKMDQRIQNQ